MQREDEFNRSAAEDFAKEYEKTTGQRLSYKRVGTPFPDAVLEMPDGTEVGIEFVSVVLSFVNREEDYFDKYRTRFYEILAPYRPRYKSFEVKLQLSAAIVAGPRPVVLPAVESPEGKQLIKEFGELLCQQFDRLSTLWGGNDGGGLIGSLRDARNEPAYALLGRYFDGIMFHRIRDDDSRRPQPDDPVITTPVVVYQTTEITTAVEQAFSVKRAKGRAYSTDILLLHTLPTEGKPHFPGTAMHASDIAASAQALLEAEEELCERFDEIWFLNEYGPQRLHKLK